MNTLRFDNRFVRDLPADSEEGPRVRQVHGALYSRVRPTPVKAPRLVAWSREVAEVLGISEDEIRSPRFAEVFGGNLVLPGMEPYAANYGGHQFGHWAGQLGDGRAISLGETINAAGQRWELQLKGAGGTPYSRSADGRAVLRSSIREFLCSEAMYHLGVPTTRALSLVATGERVLRDMFYDGNARWEPGAVVCRVAPSFVRFGNFELPASRNDIALLNRLIDFTIRRDFPELPCGDDAEPVAADVRAEWFGQVCERTARLVAHWMRVGFVHGVMNTDNMSILGLTIDYGPYGWIDDFDLDWTPNTTDAQGRRYRFGQQAQIAYWNLGQLAGALLPAFGAPEPLQAGLARYAAAFEASDNANIAAKLGLRECLPEDVELMLALYEWMQAHEVDMTIFFRTLADIDPSAATPDSVAAAFDLAYYDDAKRRAGAAAFAQWFARYAARASADGSTSIERSLRIRAASPRYVLRNYLAQEAIDRAEQDDFGGVEDLLEVLRRPYDEQPGRETYAQRRPDWARNRAGCSMLSCSS